MQAAASDGEARWGPWRVGPCELVTYSDRGPKAACGLRHRRAHARRLTAGHCGPN